MPDKEYSTTKEQAIFENLQSLRKFIAVLTEHKSKYPAIKIYKKDYDAAIKYGTTLIDFAISCSSEELKQKAEEYLLFFKDAEIVPDLPEPDGTKELPYKDDLWKAVYQADRDERDSYIEFRGVTIVMNSENKTFKLLNPGHENAQSVINDINFILERNNLKYTKVS